jgi:hypothetical protein
MAGGDLISNSVINVAGSVTDSAAMDGTGIVNLDASPGVLGLSPVPGRFEFDPLGTEIDSGQDFVFHGGQLVFGATFPGVFQALLSNFGMDASDLIELKNFSLSSVASSGPVLTVTGLTPGVISPPESIVLSFTNLPQAGAFNVAQSGANVDITWNSAGH